MIHLERQSQEAAHWSELQYADLFDEDRGSHRLVLMVEHAKHPDEEPQAVGFLVANYIGPEWELENIVVATEARGKGIGTGLMRELFERAKQANGVLVHLEVRESNRAARALYEKLEFRESGRRKSYYSNPFEDAVLYARRLP
jgi:ribosomal-protein-alanine N-acetyltransferase